MVGAVGKISAFKLKVPGSIPGFPKIQTFVWISLHYYCMCVSQNQLFFFNPVEQ